MIVVVIFLRRRKDRRIEMAAMAGTAAHRHARVLNLLHVVRVDVIHHLVHQPRRRLFRLRVVGKLQTRLSVGPNVIGIRGMARAALGAQRGFPLVH